MKSDRDERPTEGIGPLIDALKHKLFILKPETPLDRRHANRLPTLKCVRCDTPLSVTGVIRTPLVVFFLCASCGDHWNVLKPGVVFS